MKRLICFGHRGAAGHEPENTLASIRRALDFGVDWVEVDVYAVEGELVVIHDERLERTTNGVGRVMEQSLAYLRSLDAGRGERIPLLGEVFDLVDRRAGINVELKGPGTAAPTVALAEEYLKRHGWDEAQILLSSVDGVALREARQRQPRLRTGLLVDREPMASTRAARDLGAFSIHPRLDLVSDALVADAHGHGLQVFAYTANRPEEVALMAGMGVDGLFTDYPELVLPA